MFNKCPGAKIIEWDIPDPKGKETQEYRRALRIIKERIINPFSVIQNFAL